MRNRHVRGRALCLLMGITLTVGFAGCAAERRSFSNNFTITTATFDFARFLRPVQCACECPGLDGCQTSDITVATNCANGIDCDTCGPAGAADCDLDCDGDVDLDDVNIVSCLVQAGPSGNPGCCSAPSCPLVIAAVVLDPGETVGMHQILFSTPTVGPIVIPTTTAVDPALRDLFGDLLAGDGLFDITVQDLFIVQTVAPPPICFGQIHVEATYQVLDAGGNPVPDLVVTGGAATLDSLVLFSQTHDQNDLVFASVNEPAVSGEPPTVPTASTWGLLVMALTLLVVARITFRRYLSIAR